jgi:hypothetical protein
MAKDSSGVMSWASCRANKNHRNDISYSLGISYDKVGLHPNCEGCSHIVNKTCKFVKFPKIRKWPCFFRDNV